MDEDRTQQHCEVQVQPQPSLGKSCRKSTQPKEEDKEEEEEEEEDDEEDNGAIRRMIFPTKQMCSM